MRGSDPGPLSPAADTGEWRPRLRLWFRDEADGPGSWTNQPVPVERIADDFGRDLGWIAFSVSLDLGSTSAALRWCKTCREGNPFRLGLRGQVRAQADHGHVEWHGLLVAAPERSWSGRHHRQVVTFGIQALAAANNAHHAVRGR